MSPSSQVGGDPEGHILDCGDLAVLTSDNVFTVSVAALPCPEFTWTWLVSISSRKLNLDRRQLDSAAGIWLLYAWPNGFGQASSMMACHTFLKLGFLGECLGHSGCQLKTNLRSGQYHPSVSGATLLCLAVWLSQYPPTHRAISSGALIAESRPLLHHLVLS